MLGVFLPESGDPAEGSPPARRAREETQRKYGRTVRQEWFPEEIGKN